MYEQTLDGTLLARGQNQTASTAALTTDMNGPIGYWIMGGYGNGYAVTRDPSYLSAIQTAAGTYASMYVPTAGVLNTVPSQHAGTANNIIDDMPGLELLFFAAQTAATPVGTTSR